MEAGETEKDGRSGEGGGGGTTQGRAGVFASPSPATVPTDRTNVIQRESSRSFCLGVHLLERNRTRAVVLEERLNDGRPYANVPVKGNVEDRDSSWGISTRYFSDVVQRR